MKCEDTITNVCQSFMAPNVITNRSPCVRAGYRPAVCATLDRQIDNLVYELYDLTPEEIAIVEGTGQ